ncbi:MAG: hypothetical protein ACREJO_14985 [Phycisphaerales bacterium]
MNEIIAAAVAGLSAVAVDAAKEGATQLAKGAWGKIKGALNWTEDPKPTEVKALAERALSARPELAPQVQQIVNEYTQQVATVNVGTLGSMNLSGATVTTAKQINVGHNEGGINA